MKTSAAIIHKLKPGFTPKTNLCKGESGGIVSDKDGIKNRW